MKNVAFKSKTSFFQQSRPANHKGISLTPPDYGIEFADRQAEEISTEQSSQPIIQAKLTIGRPGDKYEQEADRIADQIVRMSETSSGHYEPLPPYQRGTEVKQQDMLIPTKDTYGIGKAHRNFSQTAISSLTGGIPLPKSERQFFEHRFGKSFENVHIHNGMNADFAARSIGARAFTQGNHIAFARDQYRPGTEDGRKLLAHELTHTLQQGQQRVDTGIVQADFWDTLGRGWELYWSQDDEGAPFARELMEHYLLGFGTDFDVSSGTDRDWNQFMLARPEIQRAMRPVLESIASQAASGGATEQPWFRWGAGPTINETVTGVRLNELESMRLTLHGCHRIEVEVNYDVNDISGGQEVIFRRISMTWVDRGDMHPGIATELDSGDVVGDEELTSAGSSFKIFIEFSPTERSIYHVIGSSVTKVSGWPPAPGAASPGQRG